MTPLPRQQRPVAPAIERIPVAGFATTPDMLAEYFAKVKLGQWAPHPLRGMINSANLLRAMRKQKVGTIPTEATQRFDLAMVTEAQHWINKALYAYLGYKYLQQGGYQSLAEQSFYYSRFYLNCVLARIQGSAVTHASDGRTALIFRKCLEPHEYVLAYAPGGGGVHTMAWDLAKKAYQTFDPDGILGVSSEEFRVLFAMEREREISEFSLRREELEDREQTTYDPLGFDELYWDRPRIRGRTRGMGSINFLDTEVFNKDTYRGAENGETADPRGLSEVLHGELINISFQLLGKIHRAAGGRTFIRLYWHQLSAMPSNEEAKVTLRGWAEAAGVALEQPAKPSDVDTL